MKRMRTGRFVCGIMVAGLALMGAWRVLCALDGDIHSTEIEVDGKILTVAVFRIEPPIAFPVLYQRGDLASEMKRYTWLKPVMFNRNGFEAFVPRDEWKEYAAYDWTEKNYEYVSGLRKKLERVVRDDKFWSGAYSRVSHVILCVLNGEGYLQITINSYEKNGKYLGPDPHTLKFLDGKWKRFSVKDDGAFALTFFKCYENAIKLVEEGKLQENPIRKLK